jgi:hypothetical protein
MADDKRAMLRHTLATLAYRAGKVLRGAPDAFATFEAGTGVRTPAEVLAHIGDVMDWGLSLARGAQAWHTSAPRDWEDEVARFFDAIAAFDTYLASEEPLHETAEQLFQGPVADALAHVGQIGMMRRMAGAPVRGENYFVAAISVGRVGAIQEAPRYEFD